MPPALSLNTQQWPAIGASPDSYSDYAYVAGEQPIASFDNKVMWNLTTDLQNLNTELGEHGTRHEVGGQDELDLQNMQVNGVLAFNGDPATNEYRWVNPLTSSSIARIDVDDQVIRQFPAFGTLLKANAGVQTGNDITRPDGSVIYDYSVDKVEHAKLADHALTADHADVADSLSGSTAGDFLTADENATITAPQWTYVNPIAGDITGNAATADTADYAPEAGHAADADQAVNSDTVDGYHAQQLINEAIAGSNNPQWTPITEGFYVDTNTSDPFNWNFTSPTTYDRYRIDVYHESYENYKIYTKFRMQNEHRNRYNMQYIRGFRNDIAHSRQVDHISSIGGVHPDEYSWQSIIVTCPEQLTNHGNHYPVVSNAEAAMGVPPVSVNHTQVLLWAEMEVPHQQVNQFELEGTGDAAGKVRIFGQNI